MPSIFDFAPDSSQPRRRFSIFDTMPEPTRIPIPADVAGNPALQNAPASSVVRESRPPEIPWFKIEKPVDGPSFQAPEQGTYAQPPKGFVGEMVDPYLAFSGSVVEAFPFGRGGELAQMVDPNLRKQQAESPILSSTGHLIGSLPAFGAAHKVVSAIPGIAQTPGIVQEALTGLTYGGAATGDPVEAAKIGGEFALFGAGMRALGPLARGAAKLPGEPLRPTEPSLVPAIPEPRVVAEAPVEQRIAERRGIDRGTADRRTSLGQVAETVAESPQGPANLAEAQLREREVLRQIEEAAPKPEVSMRRPELANVSDEELLARVQQAQQSVDAELKAGNFPAKTETVNLESEAIARGILKPEEAKFPGEVVKMRQTLEAAMADRVPPRPPAVQREAVIEETVPGPERRPLSPENQAVEDQISAEIQKANLVPPAEAAGKPEDLITLKEARTKLIQEGVPRAEAHKMARAQAAQPPKKRIEVAEPVIAEVPETVGLSKRNITNLEERHPEIKELPLYEKEQWGQWQQEAIERGHDQNALSLADEVIRQRRQITNAEFIGMDMKLARLENEYDASVAESARLIAQGNTEAARLEFARRESMLDQMERLRTGATYGKREVARALGSFQIEIRRDDMSIARVLQEATASKGTRLSEAEVEKFENAAKEIQKLKQELADQEAKWTVELEKRAQERASQIIAQRPRITEIAKRTATKRAHLDQEIATLEQEINALGFRMNEAFGLSAEAAYKVGRLALKYAERSGATSIDAVIREAQKKFPDLSRRDILEALNMKDPALQAKAKRTAERNMRALKTQARLLLEIDKSNEIKDIGKSLTELRSQAYYSGVDADALERGIQRINELQDQIANLKRASKGEAAPQPEALAKIKDEVTQIRKELRIDKARADIEEQLRSGDFKITERPQAQELSPELERKQVELAAARKKLRQEIRELQPKSLGEKLQIIPNIYRTSQATADISSTLRQGLIPQARLLFTNPAKAKEVNTEALKALFSEYSAEQIDASIRAMPQHYLRLKGGLELPEVGGGITRGEEYYAGKLIEKVPGWGKVVRGSERDMVTRLNLLRIARYDHFLEMFPNATTAELKAMADWINVTSGRGNLKTLGPTTLKFLNAVWFAPKFAASRLQTPYLMAKYWKLPRVRGEMAKDMASTIGLGMAVLTGARLAGLEVGYDPMSPDFGKIVIGNTRVDIWGGFQQPVRLMLRLIGMAKEGAGFTGAKVEDDPLEMIGRFSAYKFGPAVTLPYWALTGKKITGEKVGPIEMGVSSVFPLFVQDVVDAYKVEGGGRAALVGGLTFFGVGASTYERKRKSPPIQGLPEPPRPPSPPRPTMYPQ